MKCKCGFPNGHWDQLEQAWCILGDSFIVAECISHDSQIESTSLQYFYNGQEYSWEEVVRLCELKAFL